MPGTEKTTLAPCPFCGGKAQYADGSPDDGEWVECVKCKACSVMMLPLMEGVKGLLAERWNERADLAKPSEWISSELKRLLLAVNKVTAQHRHHNLPTKKALDNLANRQLEYEESLCPLPSPPDKE